MNERERSFHTYISCPLHISVIYGRFSSFFSIAVFCTERQMISSSLSIAQASSAYRSVARAHSVCAVPDGVCCSYKKHHKNTRRTMYHTQISIYTCTHKQQSSTLLHLHHPFNSSLALPLVRSLINCFQWNWT